MAFVRWRGNTAQILASAWIDGKSKQIRVLSLPPGERTVSKGLKEVVASQLPSVTIDWDEIQTLLDAGPGGGEYMRVAVQLFEWSASLDLTREERQKLREASDVLMAFSLRKP